MLKKVIEMKKLLKSVNLKNIDNLTDEQRFELIEKITKKKEELENKIKTMEEKKEMKK